MAFLLGSEKAELLDGYRKKLRNAELKKSEIEAEIKSLCDVISSIEQMTTVSEIAILSRSNLQEQA